MKNKNDISVASCIFSKDLEEILLIKRRDVPVWVLPGGGIDPNETPEKAICREVEEETGYKVSIKRKIGEYFPLNRLTRVTHLYKCEIISGEASTSDETKEVKFFSLKNLPLMPPPYADWIKDGKYNYP